MLITLLSILIPSLATMVAAYLGAFDKIHNFFKKIPLKKKTDISISFVKLTELSDCINKLFLETIADRFLILMSESEHSINSWVSAIYEQHRYDSIDDVSFKLSVGATNKYIKLGTDIYYKQLIDDIRHTSPLKLTTINMQDSVLKSIYLYEKVTYSNIYFLYDIEIENKERVTIFCSIATHINRPFNQEEELLMKLTVDKIKNTILNYEQ